MGRDLYAAPALVALFVGLTLLQNQVYDYQPGNDSLIYLARAREFARGDFLNPTTNWNLAPGYSLFLALPAVLGVLETWALVAIQATALASAYLVLVRRLRERGVLTAKGSAVAVAALVLNPNIWASAGSLLSEPFTATLLLVCAGIVLSRSPVAPASTLGLGVAVSWLVLTRFEYVALLPVLGMLAWAQDRAVARRTLLVLAVAPALVLLPNAFRNQHMYGVSTPFSLGGGVVLYAGANAGGDGAYHSGVCTLREVPGYLAPDMVNAFHEVCRQQEADPNGTYLELDRLYKIAAATQWRNDPRKVIAAWPSKFMRLWLMPGSFDIYTADVSFNKGLQLGAHLDVARWPLHGVLKHALYILIHWVTLAGLALAAVRGMTSGGPATKVWGRFTLACAGVLTALVVAVSYGLPRFHVPVLVVLLTMVGMLPRDEVEARTQ